MTIYEDFYNYKTGIYHHVSGEDMGGHSVKLVGWGRDQVGKLFWIAQNQWSDKWGEDGYARIYEK